MGTPQLRMLCASLMPAGTVAFLGLSSGGPEHAMSSSAFLSSSVPDSELRASVFYTLDVETGGWDGCRCCVQDHTVEVGGLSRIIKTRHHDLHLPLACRTFPLSRARWTLDSSLSDSWQRLQSAT